jgi:adhesin/invasin
VGVLSGSAQFAPISTSLPAPLIVRVTDQYGASFPGATVTFTATGGATVGTASAVTDVNGQAQTTVMFSTQAGVDSVIAAVAGVTTPAVFIENAQAGPVTSFAILQGNGQTGTTGTVLPITLAVQAKDTLGNPVVGDSVTFTSATGTLGIMGTATVVTDVTGTAQVPFTPALGANSITAALQNTALTLTFSETGN